MTGSWRKSGSFNNSRLDKSWDQSIIGSKRKVGLNQQIGTREKSGSVYNREPEVSLARSITGNYRKVGTPSITGN